MMTVCNGGSIESVSPRGICSHSYRMSVGTFMKSIDGVKRSEEVLEDAIAVARAVCEAL